MNTYDTIKNNPCVIIAIGGIGYHVLMNLKQSIIKYYGSLEESPYINFQYIDVTINSSSNYDSEIQLKKSEITNIHLNKNDLLEDEKLPSFYKNLKILSSDLNYGPSLERVNGWLSFYYSRDMIKHSLELSIKNSIKAVLTYKEELSLSPTIYIISSLYGSTGGGIFIDVAYLVREILFDIKNIHSAIEGIFILPGTYENNKSMLQANAYAALKELNHFSYEDTEYSINCKDIEFKCKDSPFDNCCLLEPRNNKNINDEIPILISMITHKLILDLNLDFQKYYRSCLANRRVFNNDNGHSIPNLYSTIQASEILLGTDYIYKNINENIQDIQDIINELDSYSILKEAPLNENFQLSFILFPEEIDNTAFIYKISPVFTKLKFDCLTIALKDRLLIYREKLVFPLCRLSSIDNYRESYDKYIDHERPLHTRININWKPIFDNYKAIDRSKRNPRKIFSVSDLSIGKNIIKVCTESIVKLNVDAIAFSRTRKLEIREASIDSVHYSIQKYGGSAIDEEASKNSFLEHGGICVTHSGNLVTDYVIHVAMIDDINNFPINDKILKIALKSIFEECIKREWKSIALPLMGTRVGNLSHEKCAEIMLNEAIIHYYKGLTFPEVIIFSAPGGKGLAKFVSNITNYNSKYLNTQNNNMPKSLKVFLCHSSNDKFIARILYKQLRDQGFEPWLDEENLLPGQDWQSEIKNAIKHTDIVIAILSNNSINKIGYVNKEIKYALDIADEQPENSIFIVPLRVEKCQIPDRLSHLHWVNYYDKNGYERLINSLKERARNLDCLYFE